MGRYRKIDPRMWGDEKFRDLSRPAPNAQSLWQYLLTGPHTNGCPGLYHVGEMALAESLEWSIEGFRKPFAELLQKGMIKADFKARVIFIPNAIRYDPPDNPNVLKKWGKDFDEIPECDIKYEYYQHIKLFVEGLGKGFHEAFKKAFKEPFDKRYANTMPEPKPLPKPNKQVVVGNSGIDSNVGSEGGVCGVLSDPPKEPPEPSKKEKKTDPRIKEFIDFYHDEFVRRFQIKPVIQGAKEGALVQGLLHLIDFTELKDLLIAFFESDDPFVQTSGYGIGAFKSQINKLRVAPQKRRQALPEEQWLNYHEGKDEKAGPKKIHGRHDTNADHSSRSDSDE